MTRESVMESGGKNKSKIYHLSQNRKGKGYVSNAYSLFFPIRFHVFAVEFKFALEDVQDVIKVKGEPIQSIKFTFDSDTVIGQQNTVGKLRRKCSNYCAKEMF